MSEPVEPTASPSSSTLQPATQLIAAGVTVLFTLALLDVSVETALRHSPVQVVVIGGTVLCFVLLTVLWKRTSWAIKAQLATLFLLAIACATSWLSGGMNNGIALAGEGTNSILLVISCLGVLAAGACLLSLPVPRWLKLAAIVITAYGAAAFVLALVNRSDYVSVFDGDSVWTKA